MTMLANRAIAMGMALMVFGVAFTSGDNRFGGDFFPPGARQALKMAQEQYQRGQQQLAQAQENLQRQLKNIQNFPKLSPSGFSSSSGVSTVVHSGIDSAGKPYHFLIQDKIENGILNRTETIYNDTTKQYETKSSLYDLNKSPPTPILA